jgi:hypothetical protein
MLRAHTFFILPYPTIPVNSLFFVLEVVVVNIVFNDPTGIRIQITGVKVRVPNR